jgi:hypothetical protein
VNSYLKELSDLCGITKEPMRRVKEKYIGIVA